MEGLAVIKPYGQTGIDEPVGGEFLFKLPLAADTSHGSRNSIGNYSGEQCFDQCWPASGQVLSLRVLGEHGPGCNIL